MPAKETTSSILAQLGKRAQEAHNKHKGDTIRDDEFAKVPPGIINGVAQLVDAKVANLKTGNNAGQPCFFARAICLSPETVLTKEGQRLKAQGLNTQIREELFETKNSKGVVTTFDAHWDEFYNHLRKLGVDTDSIQRAEDIETQVLPALIKAAPCFQFRTTRSEPTKEYPDPRTFENWGGLVPPDIINTETNGQQQQDSTLDAEATSNNDSAGEAAATGDEEMSLEELGTAADNKDEASIDELERRAEAAGISKEVVNSAKSWADVVRLILKHETGDTEEETTAEVEWSPSVEEVYRYRPIDPKTKKAGKAVECQVTAVDIKNKTLTLKNLANAKLVYKNVKWDALESAE
jgi:hypothetical protein